MGHCLPSRSLKCVIVYINLDVNVTRELFICQDAFFFEALKDLWLLKKQIGDIYTMLWQSRCDIHFNPSSTKSSSVYIKWRSLLRDNIKLVFTFLVIDSFTSTEFIISSLLIRYKTTEAKTIYFYLCICMVATHLISNYITYILCIYDVWSIYDVPFVNFI